MNKRLMIVQPYVPAYREAFFDQLVARLQLQGVDCLVVAGEPDVEQATRGDSIEAPWLIRVKQRKLRIAGKTIGLGGSRKVWKKADGVIVGHLGSSLDTYIALLTARFGHLKVGLWGHIKNYVNDAHPLDAALERWQLRHANHVFAYTESGSEYARTVGVKDGRTTTVMNTVDSTLLSQSYASVTKVSAHDFASRHGVTPTKTLAYVGGLDDSKRIDFIVAVLDELWVLDPDIRLLVGGDGVKKSAFDSAVRRGQVIMLGYVSAATKALIGKVSAAFVIPGRVGLVAVDALILRTPILTTAWPYHAPEFDYLVEGKSKFTLPDDPAQFAQGVVEVVKSAATGELFNSDIESDWAYPTIENMVDNYAAGVIRMLSD